MSISHIYVEVNNRCGQTKFLMRLSADDETIATLERASLKTSDAIPLSDKVGKGKFRIFGHTTHVSKDGEKTYYFLAVHAVRLH